MWSFPEDWEQALWDVVAARVPSEVIEARSLVRAIAERSDLYTRARDRMDAPIRLRARAGDLAARALFFTVADAAKIGIPLAELAGRGLIRATDPLRVLDLGAGVGAMTIGLAAVARTTSVSAPRIPRLVGRKLEVLAIDRDPEALALLAEWTTRIQGDVTLALTTTVADVRAPVPAGTWDLILAGGLLNELDPPERAPLVRRLLSRLDPAGALIIVEPALRETTRALHELRDELLGAGDASVFAPCTRASAPCPALADERDWCHEDRPFSPPPRLAQLSRGTGLRREGLKLAYLTLRRDGAPQIDPTPDRRALRVVSGPLDQKGTVERMVCGADGRVRLRVLRRHAGEAKHVLGASRRGDVLVATQDEPPELVRVRPADQGLADE